MEFVSWRLLAWLLRVSGWVSWELFRQRGAKPGDLSRAHREEPNSFTSLSRSAAAMPSGCSSPKDGLSGSG